MGDAIGAMPYAFRHAIGALALAASAIGCDRAPPAEPAPAPAAASEPASAPAPAAVNPADLEPAEVMGLAAGAGRTMVVTHCTACHSTALVTQNRMTRDRWDATITWMQETQNLWPIPADQRAQLLDYLEAVQGPLALNPGVNGPPVYPPNPIW